MVPKALIGSSSFARRETVAGVVAVLREGRKPDGRYRRARFTTARSFSSKDARRYAIKRRLRADLINDFNVLSHIEPRGSK